MIYNKKGDLQEGILMIVRVAIVAVIAFAVFGIVAIFYTHDINIRNSDAIIVGKNVVECLAPNGLFDSDSYPGDEMDKVLSYCGFSGNIDILFVRVTIGKSVGGSGDIVLYQGDSGALWVRELYKNGEVQLSDDIKKFEPGYFKEDYKIVQKSHDQSFDSSMQVEVLVKHDL